MRIRHSPMLAAIFLTAAGPAAAQQFPTEDEVIRAIWTEGMENSQLRPLAHELLDQIGPRLTGTPGMRSANDWAVETLSGWGVEARNEQYGTWRGWERGSSHLDLVAPRLRSMNAMSLPWSPGTDGHVEAGVVTLPPDSGTAAFDAWLPSVEGNFVLLSMPNESCRPLSSFEEHGGTEDRDRIREERTAMANAWQARIAAIGYERSKILEYLAASGAAGVLTNMWAGGWGADRIFPLAYAFGAMSDDLPAFNLSCEDYGLIYRLAESGSDPRVRAHSEARDLGDQPVFNTIGMIRGSELPNEYVILSAHFDSWDGGSGATDNGTGSLTMLEAMRILSTVYPNPRRTILIGLWASEEQGLNGSRAFGADHPEVVDGMQALFNQDNGTGQVARMSAGGLTEAGAHVARWMSVVPSELIGDIDLSLPGTPAAGGTDHAAFACAGAPALGLGSASWDYFGYTWHTSVDTYDKIVFENVQGNAVLTAMLAYMASEDPTFVPRDRRVMPVNPSTGEQRDWPSCSDGARTTMERFLP